MDVLERIRQQVESNPIIIYMKGTPQFPMCGFSGRAVQALAATGIQFAYVNILEDPEIFQNLPRYADWPTFPQIFINGELVDIQDALVTQQDEVRLYPPVSGG